MGFSELINLLKQQNESGKGFLIHLNTDDLEEKSCRNTGIEFAEKLSKAYSETCKPLCHELNIPQTAFDILLFLANNPEYKTARDIVEIRKIKANLVSVNVDKLVNEGYLERKSVEGDRRKVNLICTEKSKEIIQEGQKLQQSFVEKLFEGMDEDTRKALQKGMAHMEANIEKMLEEKN